MAASSPCCPRHKLADQRTRKSLDRGEFRLLHYAGEVTYNVTGEDPKAMFPRGSWEKGSASPHVCSLPSGFLDKNNDLLFRNLKEVRRTSRGRAEGLGSE